MLTLVSHQPRVSNNTSSHASDVNRYQSDGRVKHSKLILVLLPTLALLTVTLQWLPGNANPVACLVDSGATHTFIAAEVVERLGL